MIIFSFSLYGSNPKYTQGAIENSRILAKRFPDALMYVYMAPSVPETIRHTLESMPNVRIVSVTEKAGTLGTFDRYYAIDVSGCDIMFVRDADSRIHERDAACIEDFIAAPDKYFQIIRDHIYHSSRILAGMIGLRKEALTQPMSELIANTKCYDPHYGADQYFLESEFYQKWLHKAQIYDRYSKYEPSHMLTPFRVPIVDHLFIGQVHLFREDGTEYVEFDAHRPARI